LLSSKLQKNQSYESAAGDALINASPAPATLILFFPRDFFLILGVFITPVAGLIFETKNREIFLERFFWRKITAREHVSRAVILEKI